MASKLYYNPETAVVFKSSGGDVTFTPTSISNGHVRVSAQYDRGTGAKPGFYRWFALSKTSGAVTAGTQIVVYLAQAKDATDIPGRIGTSDASITSSATDRMRNLTCIGAVNADTTTTDALVASGVCFIHSRYISLAWLNNLGVGLSATDGDHYFELQAIPPETQ
jgi:hypothetical protein